MSEDKKVVTRFAPSPTGFMHVGNVRAALYEWLWARKNNGIFILRIEDTDQNREVDGSVEHIIECLKWLKLDYDAGPDKCDPGMCYTQSERLEIYKKYANRLIEKGYAYPDPYTVEELETFRKKAEEEKKAFLYREHRPESFGIWDGTKALRFKTPEIKTYHWHDAVFGDLSAGPEMLDDFVLIKSDGYPTYNFAHIVDDIEMNINVVMRGQEYISSTPKYLSVYEALGVKPPLYACLPHIMATGGNKKLGKRDGAKDVLDYKKEGYLPDAMINFLAFLGWNPGGEKEIYTRKELIEAFDLSRIQVSGAQMNLEKLDWINKEHVKLLTDQDFIKIAKEYIDQKTIESKNLNPAELDNYILLFRDRITKFGDLKNIFQFSPTHSGSWIDENITVMYGPNDYLLPAKPLIAYDAKNLIPKDLDKDVVIIHLKKVQELISENNWEDIVEKSDGNKLWVYATQEGRGKVLWPLRVALSGQMKSPDPFEIMKVIGKDPTLQRINKAIEALNGKNLTTEAKNNNIGITFTE